MDLIYAVIVFVLAFAVFGGFGWLLGYTEDLGGAIAIGMLVATAATFVGVALGYIFDDWGFWAPWIAAGLWCLGHLFVRGFRWFAREWHAARNAKGAPAEAGAATFVDLDGQ